LEFDSGGAATEDAASAGRESLSVPRQGLTRIADLLLPLAVVAAALALVAPSEGVAERSDWILAALVLFTALGIAPAQLARLREQKLALVALVVAPFLVLAPLAWAVSRLFSEPVREGVLALGVSSTEVAAVGLVALASGSAVLALGALTGSLVASALAGPPLLSVLAGGTDVAVGELVGRFALVVLVPLAAGLGLRALAPRLKHAEEELGGLAAMTVVVLVYGAMSGADDDGRVLSAALAAMLFLVVSAAPVAAWISIAPRGLRITGALVIELRDFAVAAALATQAFGPPAATVSGVYGVLMLVVGAAAVQVMPRLAVRRRSRCQQRASREPPADSNS
jgi:bile acid:Na+ symporter, BASS family